MKKQTAFTLLGATTEVEVARALGCTRQYVHKWPEELPRHIADRVVGVVARREWEHAPPEAVRHCPAIVRDALDLRLTL